MAAQNNNYWTLVVLGIYFVYTLYQKLLMIHNKIKMLFAIFICIIYGECHLSTLDAERQMALERLAQPHLCVSAMPLYKFHYNGHMVKIK